MLVAGSMISCFRVESLIGKGGMGEVYKGFDTQLNRDVAIKALNPELTADQDFLNRFRQEAQIQARLIHPNIVSMFTMREEFGVYYMVMEYAPGTTLREIINTVGPIPEERALRILSQILQGLAYAHERGIIHRDIKPSNIMVDTHDNVKILDFGIARMVGEKGLTRTGQNVGTIYYMSPEQVRAEKDIDQRSDIFSLGITYFEMLTGRVPYNTDTSSDYAIMDEIVRQPLNDPRSYYAYISDPTVQMLNQMTQKDRSQRYVSCVAVLNTIQGIWRPQANQGFGAEISGQQFFQPAFNSQSYAENPQDQPANKYYGVKGWLLLLCIIMTILQPIVSVASINDVSQVSDYIPSDYSTFITIALIYDLVNLILSLVLGIGLWSKKPNAPKNMKLFFLIRPCVAFLLTGYASTIDDDIGVEVASMFVQALVFSIVWGLYLAKSKRVKATFGA